MAVGLGEAPDVGGVDGDGRLGHGHRLEDLQGVEAEAEATRGWMFGGVERGDAEVGGGEPVGYGVVGDGAGEDESITDAPAAGEADDGAPTGPIADEGDPDRAALQSIHGADEGEQVVPPLERPHVGEEWDVGGKVESRSCLVAVSRCEPIGVDAPGDAHGLVTVGAGDQTRIGGDESPRQTQRDRAHPLVEDLGDHGTSKRSADHGAEAVRRAAFVDDVRPERGGVHQGSRKAAGSPRVGRWGRKALRNSCHASNPRTAGSLASEQQRRAAGLEVMEQLANVCRAAFGPRRVDLGRDQEHPRGAW